MFKQKMNFKFYFLINSLFILMVSFPYWGYPEKILGFLILFFGVALNQIFLVKGVSLLISTVTAEDAKQLKRNRMKALLYLILKAIILIGAFTISVQFIRNEIKMALLFYILSFISLYISLTKGLKHDE